MGKRRGSNGRAPRAAAVKSSIPSDRIIELVVAGALKHGQLDPWHHNLGDLYRVLESTEVEQHAKVSRALKRMMWHEAESCMVFGVSSLIGDGLRRMKVNVEGIPPDPLEKVE